MSEREVPVVAIDGPSGVGKGTLMQRLGSALGFHLLDSGATYRVLALAAGEAGIASDDVAALVSLSEQVDVRFAAAESGPPRPIVDGRDVADALRSERCGEMASQLAVHAPVRAALLGLQRGFRRPPGLVADGRDMGTVVFPDAALKLFLDASPQARAQRRHKQLMEKGESASLRRLLADIEARDARDRGRAEAPLRPAPDAVLVDTTTLDIEAVVDRALLLARQRLGASLGM